MPVRPVCHFPHRVLKQAARPVGNDLPKGLVDDLVDTMAASPACVGLAATQIGVPLRVAAVDVTGHKKTTRCHGLVVLLDPLVIEATGRHVAREGCLSVPDLTANVARATEIVVSGRSPDGRDVVLATEGFEARAWQHEIDHLDGFLILDRVASLATDVFRRRVYE